MLTYHVALAGSFVVGFALGVLLALLAVFAGRSE